MSRDALMTASRTHSRVGQVTLIDLLDRLLQGGVVLQGDIILSVADVDLVRLDLRLLIAAVETAAAS